MSMLFKCDKCEAKSERMNQIKMTIYDCDIAKPINESFDVKDDIVIYQCDDCMKKTRAAVLGK